MTTLFQTEELAVRLERIGALDRYFNPHGCRLQSEVLFLNRDLKVEIAQLLASHFSEDGVTCILGFPTEKDLSMLVAEALEQATGHQVTAVYCDHTPDVLDIRKRLVMSQVFKGAIGQRLAVIAETTSFPARDLIALAKTFDATLSGAGFIANTAQASAGAFGLTIEKFVCLVER